jgi:hypothetical protein
MIFFKLFLVFFIYCLLSMDLTSYDLPILSYMPQRSNHDTGCWEREGTATLGRAAVALGLWSADIIISTRRGLHGGSSAAPVLGTGQWQSKGRDCSCTEG